MMCASLTSKEIFVKKCHVLYTPRKKKRPAAVANPIIPSDIFLESSITVLLSLSLNALNEKYDQHTN